MTLQELEQLEAQLEKTVEVSLAACSLSLRRWREKPIPRRDRIWSGVLAGRRTYRGQQVILPDRTIGFIFGIQRGWAAIWQPAPFVVGERKEFVLRVDQIEPYKLPSAVALGRCKAGKQERPSNRKRAACRVNGVQPVRSGSRPRGRPRKPSAGLSPLVGLVPQPHASARLYR